MQTQKLSAILKKLLTSVLILSFTFSSFPFDVFAQERTLNTGSEESEPQAPAPRETKPEGEPITPENPIDTRPEEHKPEHPELDLPSVDNDAPRPDEGDRDAKDEREREGGIAGGESEETNTASLQSKDSKIKTSVSENDGSLNSYYEINLPAGRNGFTPSIALQYSSSNKKNDSYAGYGWSLNIPSIERVNKWGSEKLYDTFDFNSSQYGELIKINETTYVPRDTSGSFVKIKFENNLWVITDSIGTKWFYGNGTGSQLADPSNLNKVYKWMLQQVIDTNGNTIDYTYFKDSNQIYPDKISYGNNSISNHPFVADFIYSTHDTGPKQYYSLFPVKTNKRLSEIDVLVNGESAWNYEFAYNVGDAGYRSLLESAKHVGLGIEKTTEFGYKQKGEIGFELVTNGKWQLPFALYETDGSNKSYNIVLTDVSGDSYPDEVLLYNHGTPCLYEDRGTWINDGKGNWIEKGQCGQEYMLPKPLRLNSVSSKDGGVRLVDFNGDLYPDVAYALSEDDYTNMVSQAYYQFSILDNKWNSDELEFALGIVDNPGSNADTSARFVDLNGDGLQDQILSKRSYSGERPQDTEKAFIQKDWNEWVENFEYSQYPNYIRDTNYYGFTYSSNDIFYDINTDGLPDLLMHRDALPQYVSAQGVYLNTGVEWEEEVPQEWAFIVPLEEKKNKESGDSDAGTRMMDLNGDGIMDFLRAKKISGGSVACQQYIGTLRDVNTEGVSFLYDNEDDICLDDLYFAGTAADANPRVDTVDINSDGMTDIVFALDADNDDDYIETKTWLNKGHPFTDTLETITTEEGSVTTVGYKMSSQYRDAEENLLNPKLPILVPTVEIITTNDGFGNLSTNSYTYADGHFWYNNPRDKKFSGFGTVTSTNSLGEVTKTFFHQGNETSSSLGEYSDHISKSGKPYRTEVYDASSNLKQVGVNKWDRHDLGNGSSFVKLASTLNTNYDTTPVSTAEEYTYDNNKGNLIFKTSLGVVSSANATTYTDTGSDLIKTAILYATNAEETMSLPRREITADQSGITIKDTTTYYDNQDESDSDFITKGNPTKQTLKDTVSTNLEVKRTFDSYGLPLTETDPLGNVTQYEYDSNHLYPTKVKNPLNQETTYTYNYALGKPTEVIDPNGLKQITEYDALGRVTSQKYSTSTPVTLVTYSYNDTSFPRSVTETKYLTQTNQATSITYLDGLGRTIQTRREMEDSNKYSTTDIIYDQLGRKSKESLPYESTGTAYTQPTTNTSLYITYSYDALNRITKISNILGDTTNTYNGFTTTTTDAEGNKKNFTKDAYGNLTEVKEHNNTETYSTTYTYSPLGHLTKITDAEGNVRNFTYDLLGKRIKDEDLHKPTDTTYGIRSFTYDKAGNMISEKNAEGITTIYTYDKLNRPLTQRKLPITMTDSGEYLLSTEDSISTYDTCLNGKGRVCKVETSEGSVSYEYDALGRKTKETKVIKGETFTETFSYDRQSNLTEKTLPDTTKYSQTFNTAGLLEATSVKKLGEQTFTPVALDFDYSPEGKVLYNKNSDNTESIYTYDSNALYRLKAKVTRNTVPLESFTGGSTTTTFAVTEDGHVKAQPGNALWPIKHPDTTGMNVDNALNASLAEVNVQNFNSGVIELTRSFFSFDTSSLPDNAYIESANLKLYTIDRKDDLNDGLGWVNIYQGFQASPTALVNADINDCGTVLNPVAGSSNKAISSIPISTTTTFVLNATGTNFISKTTHTKLCMREGHDASFTYVPQGTSLKYSYYKFATKNHATVGFRPTLEVTWSTEAPPPPPPDGNLQNLNYTYDKLGNITKLEELADGDLTRSVTYAYDDLNRLTSATAKNLDNTPIYSESYTYSPIGNILTTTSMDGVVGTRTYHYDTTDYANPHAVTRIVSGDKTITLNYDKNGNLLTDGKNTYTFDQRNRLLSAKNKEGETYFTYDHTGQRTSLTTDGSTTLYPSDSYNKEVKEDASVIHTIHLSAGDALSATLQRTSPSDEEIGTTKLNFLHTDHLGGSSVITNNGSVIESTDYYPYGTIRVDELTPGSLEEQKKFTGHEYDEETGLTYMNARYYSSNVGRFVSQDPVARTFDINTAEGKMMLRNPQLQNTYAYAGNNPTYYVDPDGKFVHLAAAGIAGLVGAAGAGLYTSIRGGGIGETSAAMAGGFIAGASLIALAPVTFAEAVAAGGVSAVAGNSTTRTLNGEETTAQNVGSDFVGGALAGGGAYTVGAILQKTVSSLAINQQVNGAVAVNKVFGGLEGVTTQLDNVSVVAHNVQVYNGSVDLTDTLMGIQTGRVPLRDIYRNAEGHPELSGFSSPIREYAHPTPGINSAGPQRILEVEGNYFYSPDHYKTITPLKKKPSGGAGS
jgi:RHS repeat-associated protein